MELTKTSLGGEKEYFCKKLQKQDAHAHKHVHTHTCTHTHCEHDNIKPATTQLLLGAEMLLSLFSQPILFESKSALDTPPPPHNPAGLLSHLTHSVLSQNDSDCRSLHTESNHSHQILNNEVTMLIVQFALCVG